MKHSSILGLSQVGIIDIDFVGGKNASIGEMLQRLSVLGLRIPHGFVITVNDFKQFLEFNKPDDIITKTFKRLIIIILSRCAVPACK